MPRTPFTAQGRPKASSRSAGQTDLFQRLVEQIGNGLPNTRQHEIMCDLTLDFPGSRVLAGNKNPFSPAYREAVLEFYLSLRGRVDQGYVAARDEASFGALPKQPWTDLIPWSFRDARMVSEHIFAWGHIFHHANLRPGGSVLEYGPGSGQILLMLSRLGYRACGVDIDAGALASIRAQAAHLGLPVETECAEFGSGFDAQRFDCILFYEAFHHAFDFDQLLLRLHEKLNPGGRILLCGEPITRAPHAAVPYPWGPRLDAMSVFCMRRFGWMELGFTHDFLIRIAKATGWIAKLHRFPQCPRAAIYVLTPAKDRAVMAENATAPAHPRDAHAAAMSRASVAWRRHAPLRIPKNQMIKLLRVLAGLWRRRRGIRPPIADTN